MSASTSAQIWASYLHGQQVGDYRVGSVLGTGNFSVVFEAVHVGTGAQVAMKILLPISSGQDAIDFEQEGRLLKKLVRCSNVITLIESGTAVVTFPAAGGLSVPVQVHFHVMTAASGSLEELVEDPAVLAQMTWVERIELWRGIVLGVHQMHLKSVAHRDLKSSNCLLMVRGSRAEVRLSDLGRGRDLTLLPRLPVDEYVRGRGDLFFAPPEYLWWQGGDTVVDCKNADLYALGSMLYELVTGQPITASAIGSVQAALIQGQQDHGAGRTRDLATLRPSYRFALTDCRDRLPPVIRSETTELVAQLCDPVPQERQPRRSPGRRWPPDDGLHWLLRRADILRRRLTTAGSRSRSFSPTNIDRSA